MRLSEKRSFIALVEEIWYDWPGEGKRCLMDFEIWALDLKEVVK